VTLFGEPPVIPPSYLTTFIHEVEDLLERIEAAILTLKGSAGVAGATSIAGFTHHVETAMDKVRGGAVALTPPLVSAVLASKDHVAARLAAELGTGACDPAIGSALIAQLAVLTATAARPNLAGSVRAGNGDPTRFSTTRVYS
jgi:two-component system chemotaxis sensor kinase CheA